MVLTSHQRLTISRNFPCLNSRSAHLVDSQLTASVIIEAFDEGNIEPFTFRLHEIGIEEFDDTANVLGAFVGGKVDNEFEELFIGVFLEGDFLVEDELVVGGGGDLGGDGVVIDLDVHFAGELDFHGDGDNVEVILVNLDFLLIVWHGDCSLAEFVLFI